MAPKIFLCDPPLGHDLQFGKHVMSRNITLHEQKAKIWSPLHLDDHYIYKNLIHAQINIERYNKKFLGSLSSMQTFPTPQSHKTTPQFMKYLSTMP